MRLARALEGRKPGWNTLPGRVSGPHDGTPRMERPGSEDAVLFRNSGGAGHPERDRVQEPRRRGISIDPMADAATCREPCLVPSRPGDDASPPTRRRTAKEYGPHRLLSGKPLTSGYGL